MNDWDQNRVYAPSLTIKNGKYKMWYSGSNDSKRQIGYAQSDDPINFIRTNTSPTIPWNLINIHDIGIEHPEILINSSNQQSDYTMWFNRMNQYGNFNLYNITSNDGVIWFNQTELIFDQTSTTWDIQGRTAPSVIYDVSNQIYRMWYTAVGSGNFTSWRIGYATSKDGINWTKHPTPVLQADQPWEKTAGNNGVGNASVLFEDGIYHMFYHADRDIGHATSADGINWTKDPNNPVLTPGSDPSAFDYRRVMDPFILKKDSLYYMWYTGVGSDGRWQIGLATSDQLPPPFLSPTPSVTPTPTIVSPLTPSPTVSPTPPPTPTLIILPSLSPSITPKPSPVSSSFSPIIIVPGLGASWNPRSFFSCRLSSFGLWRLGPYVSTYNRLIKTLTQNASLKMENEVFLYAYDWRQPLNQQGAALKDYIDNLLTNKPAGTQVRLIGHSLGGLVIRSYLDNNPNSHKTKAAMTVGTPHQGTVLAYPIWEKGEVWTEDWIMKIALTQLTNHCRYIIRPINISESRFSRLRIKTPKEIIQLIAPVVRSLLPTFDFLRSEGVIKKSANLVYQNDWLPFHPFPPNLYDTNFYTLSGDNVSTLRYLDVIEPSQEEKNAGDWLDGRPINNSFVKEGDGTILQLSSSVAGVKNETIPGDHGEIMSGEEGIKKILQFLDLEKVKPAEVVPLPEVTSARALIVSIDKEAKLELTDPKAKTVISQENIIVSYNPVIGDFRLRITPQVTTQAYLHLIQMNKGQEAKSKTTLVNLRKDRPVNFLFSYSPSGQPILQQIPGR